MNLKSSMAMPWFTVRYSGDRLYLPNSSSHSSGVIGGSPPANLQSATRGACRWHTSAQRGVLLPTERKSYDATDDACHVGAACAVCGPVTCHREARAREASHAAQYHHTEHPPRAAYQPVVHLSLRGGPAVHQRGGRVCRRVCRRGGGQPSAQTHSGRHERRCDGRALQLRACGERACREPARPASPQRHPAPTSPPRNPTVACAMAWRCVPGQHGAPEGLSGLQAAWLVSRGDAGAGWDAVSYPRASEGSCDASGASSGGVSATRLCCVAAAAARPSSLPSTTRAMSLSCVARCSARLYE